MKMLSMVRSWVAVVLLASVVGTCVGQAAGRPESAPVVVQSQAPDASQQGVQAPAAANVPAPVVAPAAPKKHRVRKVVVVTLIVGAVVLTGMAGMFRD